MVDGYIKSSIKKSANINRLLYNSIPIIIKDPIDDKIDLDIVVKKVEQFLPVQLTSGVDSIYIGHFDILFDRELNALYQDGAIYVTNIQDDEKDIIDDIVHEFAHATEDIHGRVLYSDNLIEEEFLGKRNRLCHIIDGLIPQGENFPINSYLNPEYDVEFDQFLYKDIGYPVLRSAIGGLFYSPYAVTSLKEYFANGFEAYFLHKDINYMKKISPHLHSKLEQLTYEG